MFVSSGLQGSRHQDRVRSTRDLLRFTSVKCEGVEKSLQTTMQIWHQWMEKRKKDYAGSCRDYSATLRKPQLSKGEFQCKQWPLRSPTWSRKSQALIILPRWSCTGWEQPRSCVAQLRCHSRSQLATGRRWSAFLAAASFLKRDLSCTDQPWLFLGRG